MGKWLRKLGLGLTWFQEQNGFRTYQEFIDANPGWPLRAFVGLCLEDIVDREEKAARSRYTITVPGSFLVTVSAKTPEDVLIVSQAYQEIDDLNLDTWCEYDGERAIYNVDGEEYIPEEEAER